MAAIWKNDDFNAAFVSFNKTQNTVKVPLSCIIILWAVYEEELAGNWRIRSVSTQFFNINIHI